MVVNLGGAGAIMTWGSGSFLAAGQVLYIGSLTSDHTVDFVTGTSCQENDRHVRAGANLTQQIEPAVVAGAQVEDDRAQARGSELTDRRRSAQRRNGLYTVLPGWGVAVGAVATVVLNVVAETVTLSRVIEVLPPLRWFDRLGQLPV